MQNIRDSPYHVLAFKIFFVFYTFLVNKLPLVECNGNFMLHCGLQQYNPC